MGSTLSIGAYGFLGGFGALRMLLVIGLGFGVFFLWCLRKLEPIPLGRIGYLILWMILLGLSVGNSLRTTNNDLNRIDVIQIGLSVIAVFALCALMTVKRARLSLWYTCILCAPASLWITKSVLGSGNLTGYTAGYILGDDYLAPAHMQGYGLMAAFSLFVFVPKWRLMTLGLTMVLASGLAFSMARGALLLSLLLCGMIATLAICQAYWRQSTAMISRGDAKLAMLTSLFAGTGMLAQALLLEKMRARLLGLFTGGASAGGDREIYWSRAESSLDKIGLLGGGTSSYPYYVSGTAQGHPHNIVLGYWIDSGFPGMLTCLAVLLTPFLLAVLGWIRDHQNRWLILTWTTMAVFDVFEFMKSFNFYAVLPLAVVGSCAVAVATSDSRKEVAAKPVLNPA